MVDTKIKKLKLNEYDLGQTLGTGIFKMKKVPSEESESPSTKQAVNSRLSRS
jgi:hypothetical protein